MGINLPYPSTGEVIDVRTRRIGVTLPDAVGRAVQSEMMLEVAFASGRPIAAGDRFRIGRKGRRP